VRKKAKSQRVSKTQAERFIEAAKAAGTDESGKTFERVLRKIVKPKKRK